MSGPRATYTGEPVAPRWLPTCVFEGWHDRAALGLLLSEQLYRRPWWKQAGWRLGWCAAALCGHPSRLRRRSP